MTLLRRSNAYTKIDKEDPEEIFHRRAEFLIYKVLQQADSRKQRPSFLRIRSNRLKVKIGKKLKNLRRSMSMTTSAARLGVYKQIAWILKAWKRLLGCGEAIVRLPLF
ncbi:hypothetical protein HS088_TW21G01200 [Tripterygium wilfordii]|uniref:Uncharacterized protein n=1 Tax=Tripterygium wilfordii TaxID=458696 RepID=A0A7J7C4J4_TRIWF|nr:uncharacterized protein LOC119990035 [Tripterygium wilfordii]KAF5729043.1 hypothetical protein HS088_TW21G01200 [Tripterygium wilfordii]